jgi:hypothetical protein
MVMSCVVVVMVVVMCSFIDLLKTCVGETAIEHVVILDFMTEEVQVTLAMELSIMMVINSVMSRRVVDHSSN